MNSADFCGLENSVVDQKLFGIYAKSRSVGNAVCSPYHQQGWVTSFCNPTATKTKQVAAFAGFASALRQSGQWSGNTHIAKNGDALLRKAIYMPALCALRFNPLIRVFCERLKANGKNGKVVACAAMRKLIHIAFSVLKSGKPFDPTLPLNYRLIFWRQDGIY